MFFNDDVSHGFLAYTHYAYFFLCLCFHRHLRLQLPITDDNGNPENVIFHKVRSSGALLLSSYIILCCDDFDITLHVLTYILSTPQYHTTSRLLIARHCQQVWWGRRDSSHNLDFIGCSREIITDRLKMTEEMAKNIYVGKVAVIAHLPTCLAVLLYPF